MLSVMVNEIFGQLNVFQNQVDYVVNSQKVFVCDADAESIS